MVITCWGSRGSIPVSGQQYIRYGGDTTCITIHTHSDDIIIVDAGTGIRSLGNYLISQDRYHYHFLLTHGHWDHLMGLPFFKPLFLPQTEILMHRAPFHRRFMERMFSTIMAPPNFPVAYPDLKAQITWQEGRPSEFAIGSVTVVPISLSHPNTGKGYKFIENGKSFIFLTDNELGFVHPNGLPAWVYADFCENADLLIHDSEYTPEEYRRKRGWGHSSYTAVLDLALSAGVKQLGLFHLSPERTDDAMDAIVDTSRAIIADQEAEMDCFAVGQGMVFTL
ncbi:MBL fold metallo-hydrolase [Desulfosarcina sp. OttesenSCG-928-B08]|nr:MBL fold metallo-hydrolase [Desulfosarcina sp. OttesenSCG-928-B08]